MFEVSKWAMFPLRFDSVASCHYLWSFNLHVGNSLSGKYSCGDGLCTIRLELIELLERWHRQLECGTASMSNKFMPTDRKTVSRKKLPQRVKNIWRKINPLLNPRFHSILWLDIEKVFNTKLQIELSLFVLNSFKANSHYQTENKFPTVFPYMGHLHFYANYRVVKRVIK